MLDILHQKDVFPHLGITPTEVAACDFHDAIASIHAIIGTSKKWKKREVPPNF
jgi:hypothetical protein